MGTWQTRATAALGSEPNLAQYHLTDSSLSASWEGWQQLPSGKVNFPASLFHLQAHRREGLVLQFPSVHWYCKRVLRTDSSYLLFSRISSQICYLCKMGPKLQTSCQSESVNCSVIYNSLPPHGLWATRLLSPWDSPGKNTGVSNHSLLQGIFPTQGLNPHLLHCKQTLYCLSQGSAIRSYILIII